MAKVKVKILKFVGEWSPGQEAEVEEEIAKHLCAVKQLWDGEKQVDYQNAMLLSEAKEMSEAPLDINSMTAADMAAIGAKNIVHMPPDEKKAQDDYLKSIGVIKGKADSKPELAEGAVEGEAAEEAVEVPKNKKGK